MADPIDPVCLIHLKRRSEHECLYCALCYSSMTPDECWVDENGIRWNVHDECQRANRLAATLDDR